MSSHSALPPSGASAWRKCGMWVTMNRRYPQEASQAADEGNAAHWVTWELLAGRKVTEGDFAPNGQVVTQEMIEGAWLLIDFIPHGILKLHVEEPVAIGRIHDQCWGTPDLWWFDHAKMTLNLIDYKFGHGFVDEYENDQGICYIAGIVDQIAADMGVGAGALELSLRVNFTIVQPRCYSKGPVRTWSVLASDLRPHLNKLVAAANLALSDNPTAVTNCECRYCPGRHACDALQRAAYSDAELASGSNPVDMPPDAASLELRMLEHALQRLESRVTGLRECVTAYGKQGVPLKFHALQQSYGRQAWNVPVDQVLALGALMGQDLSKPGVITPKQAAKLGIDEGVITAYSITPPGAVKLTPINPTDARRVFGTTKEQ